MNEHFTRREMMRLAGALSAGAVLGVPSALAVPPETPSRTPRRRLIRVAHLTDIHVQPELRADAGMIACLHHVQSLMDKPELIVTGGDGIMDSFEADDARTQLQWDIFRRTLAAECSLPMVHCIGNHDIWGWNKRRSRTSGNEANYGKQRALENYGLAERFHAFERAGWKFIVLDSAQPPDAGGDGYVAYLDDAQYDWLERELRGAATTPVLILSHIPILSATALVWTKSERGEFRVDDSLMHRDCLRLKSLFEQRPNVKLCLSGHMHLIDRVDYNGVTYLCNGAVSGNWWKGRHKDCDEGYAVIDLFDDGSFEREYVKYGWQAAATD
jgi:3',5'-cyclic AMP phosphodiesterase CpdA